MAKMRVEVLPSRECLLWIPLRDGNLKGWRLSCGHSSDAADRLRADLEAICPGCVEPPPEPPMTVAEADKAYVDAVLAKVPAGTERTDLLKQCRRARGL